ncbi:hypothetical protein O181_016936 [Austropuccinia psidii MF-1]|uniref:DNA/pantothenate metabolism flavoprotein C-terminal domain-containing protein n=1 Tax=Austropuccinia psidii MF-1 TaxID=1389203 RepID=A0A9Q3GRI7_9BASI|nr:hypothetical protein [Austropuccinia psidii MF-1]
MIQRGCLEGKSPRCLRQRFQSFDLVLVTSPKIFKMSESSLKTSTTTIQSTFSSQDYFRTQSPPPKLQETVDQVRKFVELHALHPTRRIVLITSGGTTVPLEHNVVRFLDNFSAGTRGSSSAEYFLRSNQYAVIFLHRSHSLEPFSRHYPHSVNPFLDLLDIQSPSNSSKQQDSTSDSSGSLFPRLSSHPTSADPAESISDQISVPLNHVKPMLTILKAHHLIRSQNLLHTISFVTVNEYLYLLRAVAQVLGEPALGLGKRAMLYLAAAVSDFFIPQQKLSEHKIQGGKGSLVIEMDAVPKVLKDVTNEWSNQAFIVSFKLETDSKLLIPKAKAALERYGHHLVIANELHSRKSAVLMISKDGSIESINFNPLNNYSEENRLEKLEKAPSDYHDDNVIEIEELMINRLTALHNHWIQS